MFEQAKQFAQDKDRRRAFLLSLFLHLSALLALIWVGTRPVPIPLDTYLVIDVGTPELADEPVDAPTADAPAPQAAEALVESSEVGEPQANTPPEPAQAPVQEADEPVAETEQATEQATEQVPPTELEAATPPPEPEPAAAQPVTAEAEPPAEPLPEPLPDPLPEPLTADPPAEVTPQAAADSPETASEAETPPAETTATTLPEIEQAQLEPDPALQAVPIPRPNPNLAVAPARTIAVTPTARVTPERDVPQPRVSASVAQETDVPQPQVQASVAAAQAIPTPQIAARLSAERDVPQPQVQASVVQARSVPQPSVRASVSAARVVPRPQVQASVAVAQAIPQPGVQASVAPGRSLAVTPRVAVSAAQPVPTPQVSAAVTEVGAAGAGSAPAGVAGTEASALTPGPPIDRPEGGNAERSGQTSAAPAAQQSNLGAAAGPDGSDSPTGAPLARVPYRQNRERPLAVMLDNVNGYPQAGLLEASMVVEMPVEGGLTRLMSVYDQSDPARVGPIRSARDYFHEVAENMGGVLVHDGGSPAALEAIARSDLPSINAYTSGDLFRRDEGRDAPYNLYTQGLPLRQAINRLNLQRSQVVNGTVYRPEGNELDVNRVDVRYSGTYASAFRYVQDLNLYRWIRDGEDASDVSGQAVHADAVIVAAVEARPIPDDPEGRLYIPLRGGPATLYLRGKAVAGRWDPDGGVSFTTRLGEPVELAPFKTWVLFAPPNAVVVEQ